MSIVVERNEAEEFVENIYDPVLAPGFVVQPLPGRATNLQLNANNYSRGPVLPPHLIQAIDNVTYVVPNNDNFWNIPHLDWISERKNQTAVPNPPIFNHVFPIDTICSTFASTDLVFVEGASGCGKTTAAWAYFLQVANVPELAGNLFIWISLSLRKKIVVTSGIALVEDFDPSHVEAFYLTRYFGEINHEGLTKKRKCSSPLYPTVLIIDGITIDNASCLYNINLWFRAGIRHIKLLTSQQRLQSVLKIPVLKNRFLHLTIPPWTLEEYCNVCSNDVFFLRLYVIDWVELNCTVNILNLKEFDWSSSSIFMLDILLDLCSNILFLKLRKL